MDDASCILKKKKRFLRENILYFSKTETPVNFFKQKKTLRNFLLIF